MIEHICDRFLYKWSYHDEGNFFVMFYHPESNTTRILKYGFDCSIIPFVLGHGYFINEVTAIDPVNASPLFKSDEIPFSIALYMNDKRDSYSYYYQNICTRETFWQKINELMPEIVSAVNRYIKYLPKAVKEHYAPKL